MYEVIYTASLRNRLNFACVVALILRTLQPYLTYCKRRVNFLQNIVLIDFMVITKDVGNVILHQTGY